MPDESRVGLITGVGRTEIRRIPLRPLLPDEVLVRIDAAAVCTWEQNVFTGVERPDLPFAGGHEAAGTVVATGKDVHGVSCGQRVALGLASTCGQCSWCFTYRDRVCPAHLRGNIDADGAWGPGCFSDYKIHPADAVVPVGEVSPSVAALAEPLSCAVHAARRAGPLLASDVLVIGAGVMGLLNATVCARLGARVLVTDTDSQLAADALSWGASEVFDAGAHDVRQQLLEMTDANGPELVIVTAAAHEANQFALEVVAERGTVVFFTAGHPETPLSLSPNFIHSREVRIIGSVSADRSDFFAAARMIRHKLVDLSPLVEHVYGLEALRAGLEHAAKPRTRRVLITP
ncbi:zinc-dependent alcohol dehydrogenase [Actinokineospora sp. HUAS TT18]|uniref:zinc-dependent alcohol dehydrogenase n=1 Tax=Actinokineospora sp. HUAS TT18 TaxID=3447451 RepID=UPI003F51BC70